ncbi:MAG: hypothetical protein M1838_006278 [Thelocarpon superellum]|nr:MAG: hypothetical protein M1838_006278 [Thelocarpon superellum]
MSLTNGTPDEQTGPVQLGHDLRKHFLFDDKYINLNHGSFGTYPAPVLHALQRYQVLCEKRPDPFIRYTYPADLDRSRADLASLLHVPVEEVVLVPNATTGVNTVLRSLTYQAGEKIIYFSTTYGACEKTVDYICETTPAEGIKLELKYPLSDDALVDSFRAAIKQEYQGGKTTVKVAIIDTIVALPGVHMPYQRLVQPVKEIFNPMPSSSTSKSAYVTQFEFVGTIDNGPYLCVPDALAFRRDICGGEDRIREYCIRLAKEGGDLAADILGTDVLENAEKSLRNCSFANVRLPLAISSSPDQAIGSEIPAQDLPQLCVYLSRHLVYESNTFLAFFWHANTLYARFSAQVYLNESDFQYGAHAVKRLCERIAKTRSNGQPVYLAEVGDELGHGLLGLELL